jgi:rSAM/selenodomain-associated transferase 1
VTPDQVTLAVIAKTPVAGRVKTRLCPPCAPEQAAAIAEAALRDTLDAVLATGAGRCAVVLDGERPDWIGESLHVIPQRGDGLDERLAAAFTDLGGATVVIGMDTPQVTPDLLDAVVHELCEPGVDAVLGPANDGGYWVIGLRAPRPDALVGVPMSVEDTGHHQMERLRQLGLRTRTVAELTDLDTFDEAVEVARIARGARFSAAVAAVLASLDPVTGRAEAAPT